MLQFYRNKIRLNVTYNPKVVKGLLIEHLFEHSFVLIFPKIYVDSVRKYYRRYRDMDFIDENLGIFFLEGIEYFIVLIYLL